MATIYHRDSVNVGICHRITLYSYFSDVQDITIYWSTTGSARYHPTYVPCISMFGDLPIDSGGFGRVLFTIDARIPQTLTLTEIATGIPTIVNLSSGHELLGFAPCIHGARVKIVETFHDPNNRMTPTWEYIYRYTGNVVAITHVTSASITFELENRATTEYSYLPEFVWNETTAHLDGGLVSAHITENYGNPFPMNFGCNVPWFDSSLYGAISEYQKRFYSALMGWGLPATPLLQIERNRNFKTAITGSKVFGIYNEKQTGGLSSTYSGTYGIEYLYHGLSDAPARIYSEEKGFNTYPGNSAGHYGSYAKGDGCEISMEPWMQLPIAPVHTKEILRAGVETQCPSGQNCLDGNPNTYTVVEPGSILIYEMPALGVDGWLSCNSTDAGTNPNTDWQGQYRPVGIKIVTSWIATGFPFSASIKIRFAFNNQPTYTIWPFYTVYPGTPNTDTIVTTPSGTGNIVWGIIDLPYVVSGRTVGQGFAGWANTKFATLDFRCTSSNATGNQDMPLWLAELANKEVPFVIRIENYDIANPVPAWMSGLKVILGLQATTRVYAPPSQEINIAYKHSATGRRSKGVKTIGRLRDYRSRKRGIWDRGPGRDLYATQEDEKDKYYDNVTISTRGYLDDGTGNWSFGGPYAPLETPADIGHYLIDKFSKTSVFPTGLGSTANLNYILLNWVRNSGNNGARIDRKWNINWHISSRTSVSDQLEMLLEHCLGTTVMMSPAGLARFIYWAPLDPTIESSVDRYYRGDAAYTIAASAIMCNDDGPAIELSSGDASDVVNDIEVTYGYGRNNKVAYVHPNEIDSDDGYGNLWGDNGWLITNPTVRVQALSNWSYTNYSSIVHAPKLELRLDWTDDPNIAVAVGMYHLCRYYRPEIFLSFTGTQQVADMEPGHVFRMSNDLGMKYGLYPYIYATVNWSDIYWQCTETNQVGTNTRLTQISAVRIPYHVAEEIFPVGMAGAAAGSGEEELGEVLLQTGGTPAGEGAEER